VSAAVHDVPALRHDGIFYDDPSAFASAATSFVREGVERGEVVMVNTGTSPVTALLHALFDGEEQVVFADKPVYVTPAGALEAYRRVMDSGLAAGVPGYRAMGFIDFRDSRVPWQEWLRYEAAVNRVFADYPFRTLCPYDTNRVEPDVVEALRQTHSGLVGPGGWQANSGYVDADGLLVEKALRTPRHPLQDRLPRMVLEPPRDHEELRMELFAATMFTTLPRRRVDDFVAAVTEVVTNARRHGGAPVELRLWASPDAVVATVTDRGAGIDDPLRGYARPHDPGEGLGLWAARQLCDVLDWEHTGRGFAVRVVSFG
jgi:anti-sigma regulatory factor (Ser/Thr protein kinase)